MNRTSRHVVPSLFTRSPFFVVFCVLSVLCALASPAKAQSITKRPMPTGGVTGLELALDGATRASRGGTLRWFFTLYEVVGHDALRPSRDGRLRVLVSHRPDRAVAELRTDRWGRAEIEIPIAAAVHSTSFQVIVEARSRGVARDFRLQITIDEPTRIEMVADRSEAQPGEQVSFVGRVVTGPDGRPAAGLEVHLRVTDQDGRTLSPPSEQVTGSAGAFMTSAVVPEGITSLRLTASAPGIASRRADIAIATPTAPRMVLRAVPQARLVAPASDVEVDVRLRRADGRPVRGATLVVSGSARAASPEADVIRTDANGRARITWRAPLQLDTTDVRDVRGSVTATRAGLGSATAEFVLRVAREAHHLGISVEGSALVPDLPSRIYVRVVASDGRARRDIPVTIESALFGELAARTDDDGVAVFETRPVVRAGVEGRDRCGGATASAARITVGEGESAVIVERCIPIDPDATVRVRPSSPIVASGDELEVELFVASQVGRAPVEVVLLRRRGQVLEPLARRVVTTRRATFEIPHDAIGEAILRARPLIGRTLEPVRGGTATLWVTPGPRLAVAVEASSELATVRPTSPQVGAQTAVMAVPAGELPGLIERLRRAMVPELAQQLADPSRTSGALLAGWLASRAPRDDAAPAVLRDRRAVVVPAPDSPTNFGVLRDPVRARARFIRGRLALIVRTLEHRLTEAIPNRVGDIGQRVSGRWSFNHEALEAVIGAHLLRNRTPMTLGGERMTLTDIQALDRNITFDNVARRVTRERLLQLLVHLRDFVRSRELDLWQGGRDPGPWLNLLVEEENVTEAALHDGWGRRMAIRRARGGRARFQFLTPLPSRWELVSSGPDGRFGTADDMVDPFARVLPVGCAYAEAVAEAQLLARLRRVELSQATIAVLGGILEVDGSSAESGAALTSAQGWDAVPAPMLPIDGVDHFERPWRPIERGPATLGALDDSYEAPLVLDDEPRSWGVVALGWTQEGWISLAHARTQAGFPVIVTARTPGRLHPDEPLLLPVIVARLPGGPGALVLGVEASGSIALEVEGGGAAAALPLGPGDATTALVSIRGTSPGHGVARISVSGRGNRRTFELPVDVRAPGLLRVQSAAAAVLEPTTIGLELPRDASDVEGVLVLARPSAFLADPTLERWRRRDPALLAWALAVSGGTMPPALIRDLEAATHRDGSVDGEAPRLSSACAAVAWAATTEGTHWAHRATAEAASNTGSGPPSPADSHSSEAAILAALSIAADPGDESALGRRIEGLRDSLRQAVRHNRNHPGMLARGAAALLLADHRDVRGLTMLALIRPHLTPGFRGGLVVDITTLEATVDEEDEAEAEAEEDEESDREGRRDHAQGRIGTSQLAATAAAAIAAHQAGDHALAQSLGRGLAARAHVAHSLGGEPLFWVLAARAYGVFGAADVMSVTVEQGGASRRVELGDEAVVLPLETIRPGRRAQVRVTPESDAAVPLLQTALRYVRPARASDEGPLRAALEGDAGHVGDRAAFVVVLSNVSESSVVSPVMLLTLPAGALLDETALEAMTRPPEVRRVEEPDRRGVLRLRFATLGAGEEVRFPLPLRWTAAGPRRGLALASFPADRAWELSVTPNVDFDVPFRDED